MRDVLVLAIILGSLPVILFRPYVGVLMWFWISIMTPHKFAFGFAATFPAAAVVAVPTLIGTLAARKRNRHIFNREVILLLVFSLWMLAVFLIAQSTPSYSSHMPEAQLRLIEVSKIFLMTAVTILLIDTREKLRAVLLVAIFSLALLAIKGAVFGFVTSGESRVYGTPDSFVADNNDFALALNMCLPFLFLAGRAETNRRFKLLLRVTFFAVILAVILTYSRGGLFGLGIVLSLLLTKSRYKLVSLALLLIALLGTVSFLPQKWEERMGNLFIEGKLDDSAQQRLASWAFAWNFAKHNPAGGSFECFSADQFRRYATREMPGGKESSGPHSIYFQVMAEQGFVGLFLFLSIVFSCFFSAWRLNKIGSRVPEVAWVRPYADALAIGIVGFLASGAFLGRAYFDLFYLFVAGFAVMKIIVARELQAVTRRNEDKKRISRSLQVEPALA